MGWVDNAVSMNNPSHWHLYTVLYSISLTHPSFLPIPLLQSISSFRSDYRMHPSLIPWKEQTSSGTNNTSIWWPENEERRTHILIPSSTNWHQPNHCAMEPTKHSECQVAQFQVRLLQTECHFIYTAMGWWVEKGWWWWGWGVMQGGWNRRVSVVVMVCVWGGGECWRLIVFVTV